MRTNAWLREQMDMLMDEHFADMPIENILSIQFGRKAKRRFGSIKMKRDQKESRIVINGLFRQEFVPVEIVLATIAHELCHYAHGFSSPLKQKYKHPHQGGVILKEMKKRGLEHLYRFEKKWTKANWSKILTKFFPKTRRRVRRRVRRPKQNPLIKILADLVKP